MKVKLSRVPAILGLPMSRCRMAPLGAEVLDDNGRAVGAVGQGGLLYARVPQDHGSVSVVWAIRDDAVQQQRHAASGLPAGNKGEVI